MNRGWALAFVVSASAAIALSFAAVHRARFEKTGRSPDRIRDVSELTDVEVGLVLNKIREGDLRALEGDFAAAKRAWAEAAERGRGLWPIHDGLGDSYARAGLVQEALDSYRRASRITDPRLAEVREGILRKAVLLRARPDGAKSYPEAVRRLREAKQWDRAIRLCRAWTREHPRNLEAYRMRGDLWRAKGDLKEAYRAYTSMVDVRPDDPDAHRELGRALAEMGRDREALAHFRRSSEMRPEDPARWVEVLHALKTVDPKEAQKLRSELLKKNADPRFRRVLEAVQR